jgi:hypothetical protein
MELQQLIEKWEQEMADRLKWIENEKDLAKRYIHISAHTAISDMLADVKQLNLPPVSNSVCTCNSLNYGYGAAKCFDCGKLKEFKQTDC